MENYQIGDIVFYSGLLAEVLSVNYANSGEPIKLEVVNETGQD